MSSSAPPKEGRGEFSFVDPNVIPGKTRVRMASISRPEVPVVSNTGERPSEMRKRTTLENSDSSSVHEHPGTLQVRRRYGGTADDVFDVDDDEEELFAKAEALAKVIERPIAEETVIVPSTSVSQMTQEPHLSGHLDGQPAPRASPLGDGLSTRTSPPRDVPRPHSVDERIEQGAAMVLVKEEKPVSGSERDAILSVEREAPEKRASVASKGGLSFVQALRPPARSEVAEIERPRSGGMRSGEIGPLSGISEVFQTIARRVECHLSEFDSEIKTLRAAKFFQVVDLHNNEEWRAIVPRHIELRICGIIFDDSVVDATKRSESFERNVPRFETPPHILRPAQAGAVPNSVGGVALSPHPSPSVLNVNSLEEGAGDAVRSPRMVGPGSARSASGSGSLQIETERLPRGNQRESLMGVVQDHGGDDRRDVDSWKPLVDRESDEMDQEPEMISLSDDGKGEGDIRDASRSPISSSSPDDVYVVEERPALFELPPRDPDDLPIAVGDIDAYGVDTPGYESQPTDVRENDPKNSKWKGHFSWTMQLKEVLVNIFGLKTFRTNQQEAINAALSQRDVFLLMPTGGGKSLVYQLAGMVEEGVSIVVSPLVSLIRDQGQSLRTIGIQAVELTASSGKDEYRGVMNDLAGECPVTKFIFVTPEKLAKSKRVLEAFVRLEDRGLLRRFVIDECHCVSSWGHDFRPDYRELGKLRVKFRNVPLLAMTATATPDVQKDIIGQLRMKDPVCFIQSFNRPNLTYQVLPKEGYKKTLELMTHFIEEHHSGHSGIVYCLSKKEADEVANSLNRSGLTAASYHAGLSSVRRDDVQDRWRSGQYNIMVATIAFGMGIDKPDVRFVIHFSMPKTLEGYFQESGRAGRDGARAECILYFSYGDRPRLRMLMEGAGSRDRNIRKLRAMLDYADCVDVCRRTKLLEYFGEKFESENCHQTCDVCRHPYAPVLKDYSQLAMDVLKILRSSSLTSLQVVHILRGTSRTTKGVSEFSRQTVFGRYKKFSRVLLERVINIMYCRALISDRVNHAGKAIYSTVSLVPGPDGRHDQIDFELAVRGQDVAVAIPSGSNPLVGENDAGSFQTGMPDEALYRKIRAWRMKKTATLGLTQPSLVIPDDAVRNLAIPGFDATDSGIRSVPGIAPDRVVIYGGEIIEILKAHRSGTSSTTTTTAPARGEKRKTSTRNAHAGSFPRRRRIETLHPQR